MTTGPAKPRKSALRAHATFFFQFLTRPSMIGAVAPSSPHLARRMLETVDLGPGARIAEYGPGTGVFTEAILARLAPGARFFAVERNEALADQLRARFPNLHLHTGSVEDIESFCRAEGIDKLDAVVSGLPWASFPTELQTRILDATVRVLKPGGQLITFAYHIGTVLPAGRRFRRLLPRYFESITQSPAVWRNTPPAFTLRCVGPKLPGSAPPRATRIGP